LTSKERDFFKSLFTGIVSENETAAVCFETNPNTAVLNINNGCDDIKNLLLELVEQNNGSLTNKEFNQLDQKRFRLTAREYEFAVVCDCIHALERVDRFIKEIYHSLENSAQIILLSRKENMDLPQMIDILDRNDFRAVNQIDIFDQYHLVMGKKMHMWGNGL
jgi:hypothetical protein